MSSEARHLHPQAEPLLDARLFPADFGNLTVKVERLARKLAESAVERDRRGGHARGDAGHSAGRHRAGRQAGGGSVA